MKWEYRKFWGTEDGLNEVGLEGWELVSVTEITPVLDVDEGYTEDYITGIMKRPLVERPADQTKKPSDGCGLNDGCANPEFCNAFGYSCIDPSAPNITDNILRAIGLNP